MDDFEVLLSVNVKPVLDKRGKQRTQYCVLLASTDRPLVTTARSSAIQNVIDSAAA